MTTTLTTTTTRTTRVVSAATIKRDINKIQTGVASELPSHYRSHLA